ncbi:helix-turn-helix transcriptional regulator [Saccharibacillus deserti]|uniref:helix-turn-helix transcriptional regulator n=1 Tax=Saccharibacillus deserti TaxID=1634444 RepID=UPI0015565BC4|nr:AraC family transcriptional regulator [Saccharibacillus deserti]
MYRQLEVFSDLSERLHYNRPGFPLCVYKGSLSFFETNAFAYHWHADLEFVTVLEGAMNYFVNGREIRLESGSGIFVNSKRLHHGSSGLGESCTYIVVTIHPSLLGEHTLAGKAYLDQKFGLNAEDFLRLSSEVAWQQEVLQLLVGIYDHMRTNPLQLLARAAYLSACVADHIRENSVESADANQLAAIHGMTDYIHRHYEAKITIDGIAAAGSVCRSRCCELFKRHVHLTPNNYLIQYRIQKSCEMLKETNRPVSEISLACGFQTASYFSHVFHKQTGRTPQDFRKHAAAEISPEVSRSQKDEAG